jgi:aromatic-L-amino-acid decarboxylase
MDAPAFRAMGHRMVDLIADYWDQVERHPVLSKVAPGDVLAALPLSAPEHGEFDPTRPDAFWNALSHDIDRVVMPGLTHWHHPGFFAFFSANISGPSVLADMLSAGLGVQGMLWATSPACTELEQRMLDWLGEAIGLPERFLFRAGASGGGVIAGTASESTLVSMLAARARARKAGHRGELVAYTSDQAHSSVIKAAMIAGVASSAADTTHVRRIAVDDRCRLRVDDLERAMRDDLAAGRTPFFTAATVGTTGVTAVDPVRDVCLAARRLPFQPWVHIDAAHSGAACVCPEMRWMLDGVELVDSFCFNPHKWLLVNFDCGCLWVADREPLLDALSITPEFLRNTASESGSVVDYRDWQVPLGRRFRSLKLWFVMRAYGLEGLREYIREHLRLAELFESLVRSDDRFEVVSPRTVNLVCLRLRAGGDHANKALIDAVNATGRAYLTHTTLPANHPVAPGAIILRVAISGTLTRERHVRELWDLLRTHATLPA